MRAADLELAYLRIAAASSHDALKMDTSTIQARSPTYCCLLLYCTHTLPTQVDSARANLASTFVNAFVNAGYGQDALITPEGNAWLYKNKDHGMMSAAASLGLVLLWNVEEGLTQIDKFLYSTEDHIRAGAALAGTGHCSAVSSCCIGCSCTCICVCVGVDN
jgi:hypothetical protein